MSTTNLDTNDMNDTVDTIREEYRAIAPLLGPLGAAYYVAKRGRCAAELYATQMDTAAREAQDAVVDRQADLSEAQRVARIAEGTAKAAWQEVKEARGVQASAKAAEEAAATPATPAPEP